MTRLFDVFLFRLCPAEKGGKRRERGKEKN